MEIIKKQGYAIIAVIMLLGSIGTYIVNPMMSEKYETEIHEMHKNHQRMPIISWHTQDQMHLHYLAREMIKIERWKKIPIQIAFGLSFLVLIIRIRKVCPKCSTNNSDYAKICKNCSHEFEEK
jgi:hypothetical protein